jgi:hypothetical protein
MEPYYGYSFSQSIYYSAEMCGAGTITDIAWEYNGSSLIASSAEPIKIYMGHTTKTTFANTTDWVLSGSLTEVYDGNITMTTTAGYINITLDTPFVYNGTDNLLITMDRNMGSGPTGTNSEFYAYSVSGNRSIWQYNATANQDPATCAIPGTLSIYMPNTVFSYL